jgi:hypothetical protein
MERYRARIGVNHFLLRLQWPGMPQKLVLDQIELLGQRLFPALRRIAPSAPSGSAPPRGRYPRT